MIGQTAMKTLAIVAILPQKAGVFLGTYGGYICLITS
jgi:hypothetical protein